MMDPFSIATGVVGVVAPALQGVQKLVDTIQGIANAPDTVAAPRNDLLVIRQTLTSFQAVTDDQWGSLGESVVTQVRSAITSCTASCDHFRATLGRWTRRSPDGRLSWHDRAVIGVFRQGQIRSMSEQLQNCKTTLTLAANTATLSGYLQQAHAPEESERVLSAREIEIIDAIATTDRQRGAVRQQLEALRRAETARGETDADRTDAVAQVEAELSILSTSKSLLRELLDRTRTAASQTRNHSIVNNFGAQNQGAQFGSNSGTMTLTFGRN